MENLVMKKCHNKYQPFDFKMLEKANYKDLNTLVDIDIFTSQYNNEDEIKKDLLEANFIDVDDLDKPLKIIFYEKGNTRELEYGIMYKQHLTQRDILVFLLNHINNPTILNRIYNKFKNQENKAWEPILEVLKNVRKAEHIDDLYLICKLPYKDQRNLGMYISSNFYDDVFLKELRKENPDNKESVRIRASIRNSSQLI